MAINNIFLGSQAGLGWNASLAFQVTANDLVDEFTLAMEATEYDQTDRGIAYGNLADLANFFQEKGYGGARKLEDNARTLKKLTSYARFGAEGHAIIRRMLRETPHSVVASLNTIPLNQANFDITKAYLAKHLDQISLIKGWFEGFRKRAATLALLDEVETYIKTAVTRENGVNWILAVDVDAFMRACGCKDINDIPPRIWDRIGEIKQMRESDIAAYDLKLVNVDVVGPPMSPEPEWGYVLVRRPSPTTGSEITAPDHRSPGGGTGVNVGGM